MSLCLGGEGRYVFHQDDSISTIFTARLGQLATQWPHPAHFSRSTSGFFPVKNQPFLAMHLLGHDPMTGHNGELSHLAGSMAATLLVSFTFPAPPRALALVRALDMD